MSATIETDREAVRRLLLEADGHLDKGDSSAANASTTEAEKVAARWEADGQVTELLSPLLNEGEQEYVRLGVASYLLNHGHPDLAVPVLESLDLALADLLLDSWRSRQS